MPKFAEYVYSALITLWVGALWAIGYLAAPTLFRMLDDRALAGQLAGEMFTYVAWLGIAAASYLLVFLALRKNGAAFKSVVFWLVVLMLLLTLAGYFGIQPILAQLKADSFPREVMESAPAEPFHGLARRFQCGLPCGKFAWFGAGGVAGARCALIRVRLSAPSGAAVWPEACQTSDSFCPYSCFSVKQRRDVKTGALADFAFDGDFLGLSVTASLLFSSSRFSRQTIRVLPICCTAAAPSSEQTLSKIESRMARSSPYTRILMSS